MIKKIIISFFILFHTSAFAENILTVGTYDSFAADWGPGPNIEDEFEKRHIYTYIFNIRGAVAERFH